MKTKKPKRIKIWVNEYGSSVGDVYSTVRAARSAADRMAALADVLAPTRVAVSLIELRRGEVVVDVEALVKEFEILDWNTSALFGDPSETLRAALKKVGVR